MCWVLISVQFSKSLVCCSGSVSCMLHSRLGLGCEQWFMLEYYFQSLTGAHFPSPFARNTEFLLGFCLSLLPWLLQLHYGGHSRQGYEKKKNPKTRISFCCSCFLLQFYWGLILWLMLGGEIEKNYTGNTFPWVTSSRFYFFSLIYLPLLSFQSPEVVALCISFGGFSCKQWERKAIVWLLRLDSHCKLA